MALNERKQNLTQKGGEGKPVKPSTPKDTSVFGGESAIRLNNLRNWARSDEAFKSTNLPQSERMQVVQKIFGKESFVNKQRTREKLQKIQMEKYRAKTDKEIKKLGKEIKVLEGILGK